MPPSLQRSLAGAQGCLPESRQNGGAYEQSRYLPEIRAELPEYKGVHSQVLQNVIARLELAFKDFFRRVRQGEKARYPRFKGQERVERPV